MNFEDFISEWRNRSDYIVAHTSGSTSEPKEIHISKDFVANSAKRTISFFKLTNKSHLHSCVSPEFIGGKMMAVRNELISGVLTWEKPTNEPLKGISNNVILDLVAVVPSQMDYILQNLDILPKIRNIIIGGSPIPSQLRKRISDSGLNAYETYGMTETASHIGLRKITNHLEPFKTLPGIKVTINESCCLKIIFDSGEIFQTNDLAEIISEKEFFIKGRIDDVIITGGKKINPLEIEEKIAPFVPYPFCVTGFADEKWGEKLVLLIEEKENEFFRTKIKDKIKDLFDSWMIPKEIIFVNTLPRTLNGKIKRPKDLSYLSFYFPDIHLFSSKQNTQEL